MENKLKIALASLDAVQKEITDAYPNTPVGKSLALYIDERFTKLKASVEKLSKVVVKVKEEPTQEN